MSLPIQDARTYAHSASLGTPEEPSLDWAMLRSLFGVSESSSGGALRDLDSLSVNPTRQARKITTEDELRDLAR